MTADQNGGRIETDAAAQDAWPGDELHEAHRRIEALARELMNLERGLQAHQGELSELQETVRTVDGRTQRHESNQDIAREIQETLTQLDERVAAESALRRDLAASVNRQQEREQELERELQRVLELVATRLDDFAGREAATADRQRTLIQELADQGREEQDVTGRLDELERQVSALRETDHHAGQDMARVASALQPVLTAIDSLESRTRAIQADQRRIDDDVAALRAVRDREDALLEVIEQQRATRARLEDRVSQIEEAMETLQQAHTQEDETVALLRRVVAGEQEHRRALAERIEAHRDVLLEHMRREQRAGEDHARRQIEELERQVRVDRTLLARLQEQTEDAEQEQPL